MRITRIGVVGAGTMGGGIAALAASAGVPVDLLDIPAGGNDRNAVVRASLERAMKARPAAFMDPGRASLIRVGNTDDDLGRLKECDLVIEAIIEKPEPKQALYERLEPLLRQDAILATNTSGIPMRELLEGRSVRFRERFLGMHFFNPPRYLHLLELIPTPDTSPEVLGRARRFSERVLGKGVVLAKDVPGFVANRIGVFGMVLAMRLMEKYRLTIDEADLLTGTLLSRSKSATFRTADLSGLDVIAHVTEGLSAGTGEDFALPGWVLELVRAGRVGEKSGAGFYTRQGKAIHTLDWTTGAYAPQSKPEAPELGRLARLPAHQRFAAIREWEGRHGEFAREYLVRFSHYVLVTTPVIAYDLPSVDRAMEWGYAWELGPFKQMDLMGLDFLRDEMKVLALEEPPMLRRAKGSFYDEVGQELLALQVEGGYAPVPAVPGSLDLRRKRRWKRVIEASDDATLLDVGDDVALLEWHTKLNTLGEGVLRMLETALELAERRGLAGLVIGNEDPRAFSAGADLAMVTRLLEAGDWGALDQAVRRFQGCSMRIRYAPFPVVAAPFGLTLGGGCEFMLHADRVQAHAEAYIGLVEAGVGLIPGGGGTKELLFRFTAELAPYPEADQFEAVKRAFQTIGMAITSTSAQDARRIGFLRPADRISMNRDHLLADAKARVLDLAADYVPPVPLEIVALGREALGNLHYAAWAMREAGQITDHEVRIARELAYVLSGGDGAPRRVTEQDVLDLERDAFLRLLGTRETRERMVHTLETGKPLRN